MHYRFRSWIVITRPLLLMWIVAVPIAAAASTDPPDSDAIPLEYTHTCSEQRITHTFYALCYTEAHEQAAWVAYELTRSEALRSVVDRTDNFRNDAVVRTGSASLSDYRGSGYDRGHLAPAGDMAFSQTAMSESFYLSNMSPQEPSFNRGIWRSLESLVRDWAVAKGSLQVVTGGIFTSVKERIGRNRVSVPGSYYKILFDNNPSEPTMIAFVLPNRKGSQPLSQYVTSVDRVERLTGIDFFTTLPDDLEHRLEANTDLSAWNFQSSGRSASARTSYSGNSPSTGTAAQTSSRSSARSTTQSSSRIAPGQKINVNRASLAELQKLKGIGPVKAERILKARPFSSPDDLIRVKGIGPKTLEAIRPYITVQ